MRIVHLSDIHFNNNVSQIKDIEYHLLPHLIENLTEYNEIKKIDLIIITGDLIDQAGLGFNNIKEAFEKFENQFILPISEKLKIPKENFIITPGNHDVTRKIVNKYEEHGISELLSNVEEVNDFIDNKEIERFFPYKEFESKFYDGIAGRKLTNFHSSHVINIDDYEIGISAINSSWRSKGKYDKGSLLIGERQVTNALDDINKCNIKIALMHHSLEWMCEFDKECVEKYLYDYDIVLCGHQHKSKTWSKTQNSKSAIFSIAPGSMSRNLRKDGHHSNGYSIIDFSDEVIQIEYRKYIHERGEFIIDTEKGAKDGKDIFFRNYINSIPSKNTSSPRIDENLDLKSDITNEKNLLNNYNNDMFVKGSISNDTSYLIMSNLIDFFKNNIMNIPITDDECKYYIENLDFLLNIIDKVINTISNKTIKSNIINDVRNIKLHLENINETKPNKHSSIKFVFNFLENWVKLIYLYKNSDNNIEQCEVLDCLLINEVMDYFIKLADTYDSEDEIVKLFLSSKDMFSYVKENNIYKIDKYSCTNIISQVIIMITFPVYLNINNIKKISSNTVIGDGKKLLVHDLIEKIMDEFKYHLVDFKNRDEEVNSVYNSFANFKLTVIKGENGIGKSAVLSKAIESYKDNFESPIIIHSFKHAKNIRDMFLSLLEQCNSYLINKIDIRIFHNDSNLHDSFDIQLSSVDVFKKYISEILNRMIYEFGKVYIILDSLDLMENADFIVNEIFANIPLNYHLLIITNTIHNININYENKNVNNILIDKFSRNQINEITNIKDNYNNNYGKKINDILYEVTDGKIGDLVRIIRKYEDITKITDEELDNIKKFKLNIEFKEAANKWIEPNESVLEELLLGLSLFYSISPLRLDNIQSLLATHGNKLRLPKIEQKIKLIEDQIIILNNRVQLNNKSFVDYIMNYFFSKKDLKEYIEQIFEWFIVDDEVSYTLIGDFFSYKNIYEDMYKIEFEDLLNRFIKEKYEKRNHELLLKLGSYICFEYKEMKSYGINLLEKACDMDNSEAKTILAIYYLDEEHLNDLNKIKGRNLLEDASKLGNIKAKEILGDMLINGSIISKDASYGKKLLEEAASLGSEEAKFKLAYKLIFGQGIEPSIETGKILLHELIDNDNIDAMYLLGNILIEGFDNNYNVEKGKELLEKANNMGNTSAKYILAVRMIEGQGLTQDLKIGIRMIKELDSKGDFKARYYLAKLLIEGNYISQNIEEGLSILKSLIQSKYHKAAIFYSKLLLQGKKIPRNIDEGINLLEDLAMQNNVDAEYELARILLDDEFEKNNPEKGIELLKRSFEKGNKKCGRLLATFLIDTDNLFYRDEEYGITIINKLIDEGDMGAKTFYGIRLLDNENTDEKKALGIKLLEDTAKRGDTSSKTKLAIELANGINVTQDLIRSRKFFEEAIKMGDIDAHRIFGYMLLFKFNFSRNSTYGCELLSKAIKLGNTKSKTILANAILLGYTEDFNIQRAIELLEESSIDDIVATGLLGEILIRGDYVTQDKDRGEQLLRESMNGGDVNANIKLAKMLLDGLYLTKNEIEGKELLCLAVSKGSHEAKIELSNRLIYGINYAKDVKEGIRIIEELVESNDQDAIISYAEDLINSDVIPKNLKKGEQLLRNLVELDNITAKRSLAIKLIDGQLEEKYENEGLVMLEDNISNDDEISMRLLSDYLIVGNKIEKNINRGINLLENAALNKDNIAMHILADIYLEGQVVEQDKEKGFKLLEESSRLGNIKAKIKMCNLLIDGEIIKKDTNRGLNILNQMSNDGIQVAQKELAIRLIKGDMIKKDVKNGEAILKKLVENKYISAMEDYGEMLIDGIFVEKDIKSGEDLLLLCDKIDSTGATTSASYILAKRYVNGQGLKKHKSKAIKKFEKAIKNHEQVAIFEYGLRLKEGIGIAKRISLGQSYIDRALTNKNTSLKNLFGIVAYKLKQYAFASELFYDSYKDNNLQPSISLAYMMRRNELKKRLELPSIEKLLEKGINDNIPNAKINLALSLVKRFDANQNWEEADKIFGSLGSCITAVEWWYDCSIEKDYEGDLVLGWMGRYDLIDDFDNISFDERLTKAKENGWEVPNWMFDKSRINSCQDKLQLAISEE